MKNSIKHQIVQKMDPEEYCINLFKPADYLKMFANLSIKIVYPAGINSFEDAAKHLTITLQKP
jgi:hypothetical protein